MPDDVWEQLQLDTVGPARWKQAVGNISLQTAYNESRAKAQAVMPRNAMCFMDARRFREWWPLSTASKVRGLNLYEVVQAERCHGQMDSNPACEILQKGSKVNPGSPLGQPWVPDFWVDIRGSPHKNRQPWVPATSFLFCLRWATRPNCQPLTLSHLESDGGPTASMPSAARPHYMTSPRP